MMNSDNYNTLKKRCDHCEHTFVPGESFVVHSYHEVEHTDEKRMYASTDTNNVQLCTSCALIAVSDRAKATS